MHQRRLRPAVPFAFSHGYRAADRVTQYASNKNAQKSSFFLMNTIIVERPLRIITKLQTTVTNEYNKKKIGRRI